MSLVENKYNQALDRMSGMERVERTLSLFSSICEMITLQMRRKFPNLADRELRKKVVEQFYLSDLGAQRLLKEYKHRDQR